MSIYFITFAISSIFLFCTEVDKNHKYRNTVLVFLALALPVFLAGLRKVGVGTDTKVYAYGLFQAAKQSENLWDYLNSRVFVTYKYEKVLDWEMGYNLLVYVSAKLFGTVQGVLFTTHLLIIDLIYKGIKCLDCKISAGFALLTFYLLYFGMSLNVMRQWLAMAILFYGFHFVVEKKNIKFFTAVLVAYLFHRSAVIGMVIWAVYKYIYESRKKENIGKMHIKDAYVYKLIVLALIGIIMLFNIRIAGVILSQFGSVFARYVKVYLTGTLEFSVMQIVRRLPVFFMIILCWRYLNKRTELAPFLFAMFIVEFIVAQLASLFEQSSRISYYFSLFHIILFPEIVHSLPRKRRLFAALVLLSYSIAVFYYEYVYQEWGEIIPYIFCAE